MSVMGLYFLFVASVAVWWLWREGVTAAPWLQEGEIPAYSNEAGRPKAAMAGLTVFLAVALCLFSLISAAFLIRMDSADWRSPPLPGVLWFNTAVLVLASALLQIAASAAKQGNLARMRSALASGGAVSVVFLFGQLWAWREMIAGGYYASENPANAFFFLITGAHALHLIGGLVALARAGAKAWRQENIKAVSATVELCAIYWHFLLAVWLLLLALLVGWADNLGVICRRLLL
jgi:cytochrome c oxidase subunit III